MKNILLLGDSIRIGYDKSVKKSLEGIANVYFPEDNTRFASYLLRYLTEYDRLIKDGTVDVLHWNAGLWDTLRLLGEDPHTPKDVYAYYIENSSMCSNIPVTVNYVNINKYYKTFLQNANAQTLCINDSVISDVNEILKFHKIIVNDLEHKFPKESKYEKKRSCIT